MLKNRDFFIRQKKRISKGNSPYWRSQKSTTVLKMNSWTAFPQFIISQVNKKLAYIEKKANDTNIPNPKLGLAANWLLYAGEELWQVKQDIGRRSAPNWIGRTETVQRSKTVSSCSIPFITFVSISAYLDEQFCSIYFNPS